MREKGRSFATSGNGIAVLVNETTRVIFTSLVKPHGEQVPEERKNSYELIKKYAVHPLSTVLTSTLGGTIVSIVGSTDLGTRQYIVSMTAQMGGITTYLAGSTLRKCFGGTIVLKPNQLDVKEAMTQYVSKKPNPQDENRPYLAGNIRNIITRVLGMASATLTSWYSGAYFLENYCGPTGREELLKMHGNFTGEDLRTYCIGGQGTFLFRDWGVTAINMVGFLVLQPALNFAFNKIFDYFYVAPEPDLENQGIKIEEISDSDSVDNLDV